MIPKYRFIVVYVLLIAASVFVYTHGDVYVPASKPLEQMPAQVGEWRMSGQTRFDERVLEVLKPTDYLSRSYRDSRGERLSLYLGYHGGGPDSGPIHSPKHCLPGSGWQELSTTTTSVPVGGGSIPVNLAVYQSGLQKEIFVYWYQVKGEALTSEYALKAAEVWNSMLHNRRDSAFIRISLPVEDNVEAGFQRGANFIADFYPELREFLPL
jgi:EpsI family protein